MEKSQEQNGHLLEKDKGTNATHTANSVLEQLSDIASTEEDIPPPPFGRTPPVVENAWLSKAGYLAMLDQVSNARPVYFSTQYDSWDPRINYNAQFMEEYKRQVEGKPEWKFYYRYVGERLGRFFNREEVLREVVPMFVNNVLREGTGRRERADELVEQLDKQLGRRLDTPASIICIPIAIHDEAPENINRTLAELAKQVDAEKNEIVIYANNPDVYAFRKKAAEGLLALKPILDLYPNLNVRVIHRSYPTSDLLENSMMIVRPDYMDAVVLDSHKRGLDPETPVIWLDADITMMGKNAIKTLTKDVREGKTPFVKPNLNFTVEMEKLTTDLDPTNLDHMVAIDELLRRKVYRTLKVNRKRYLEECGLSFSLMTYCLGGGVTTVLLDDTEVEGNGMGESTYMRYNLLTMISSIARANKNYNLGPLIYPGLDESDRGVLSSDASRIYASSRRAKQLIRELQSTNKIGNPRDIYNTRSFTHQDYRGRDVNLGEVLEADFSRYMLENLLELNNPHSYLGRPEKREAYRHKSEERLKRLTNGRYKPPSTSIP